MDNASSTNLELLIREAPSFLGRALTAGEQDQFARYQQLLRDWNERVNLTAIVQPVEIQRRHFLDSLACLLALPDCSRGDHRRVVDVGAGAGFPGIPLKIVCPSWHLTLIDSVAKKTAFLQHLVDQLQLDDVDVLTGRAEDLARQAEHREQYDLVLARALAPLNVLAEYCLPFARVGGLLLAPKKGAVADEEAAAQSAIQQLGGRSRPSISYRLPGLDEERSIVVVEKIAPTPPGFPRRAGVPARKPLR